MGRNYFSEFEVEELSKSKYVAKISNANIQFSEEFKNVYLQLYKDGLEPIDIIKRLGIDPKILGRTRIGSLSSRIRKQAARDEGFSRKENSSKGKHRKTKKPDFKTSEEELAYYKEYTLLLEQELAFTKKIKALEREYAATLSKAKNSK